MPYVTVDGDPIFYAAGRQANRPLLLAIHGAGGDHRHWPEELFSMTSVDCIAVDLPGHGKSGGSGRQSVDAYADFVQSLVAALRLESLTLMGHSMGGAIVQTIGLRRLPWLRKIVLVGTGAKLRVADEILQLLRTDYPKAVDLLGRLAFGSSISGSTLEQYRERLLQTLPTVTCNDFLACNEYNRMEEVHAIRVPTLIVSGAADSLTPPKYGHYLQDRIQGSLHTAIPGAGHMMALEKPIEFVEAIAAFVG